MLILVDWDMVLKWLLCAVEWLWDNLLALVAVMFSIVSWRHSIRTREIANYPSLRIGLEFARHCVRSEEATDPIMFELGTSVYYEVENLSADISVKSIKTRVELGVPQERKWLRLGRKWIPWPNETPEPAIRPGESERFNLKPTLEEFLLRAAPGMVRKTVNEIEYSVLPTLEPLRLRIHYEYEPARRILKSEDGKRSYKLTPKTRMIPVEAVNGAEDEFGQALGVDALNNPRGKGDDYWTSKEVSTRRS